MTEEKEKVCFKCLCQPGQEGESGQEEGRKRGRFWELERTRTKSPRILVVVRKLRQSFVCRCVLFCLDWCIFCNLSMSKACLV